MKTRVLLKHEVAVSRDRLETLERKALELDDYMAAMQQLSDKHYTMMDTMRRGFDTKAGIFAEGWLRYETDFGNALLKVMAERGVGS